MSTPSDKHPQAPPMGGELRALGQLAIPIILTNLTMFSMAAVDTVMVGNNSKEELAALGLAAVWIQGTTLFAAGILFGMDPIVSQAHGANDRARIRSILGQGLVIAALLCPLLMLAWSWTEGFLLTMGQQPELAKLGGQYARWQMFSAPGVMAFTAIRQWLQGQKLLKPILFHALWANTLNVLLNWVLIFGHWGMPALGLKGAAIATTITHTAMGSALILHVISHHKASVPRLGLGPHAWNRKGLLGLLAIGLPISFQVSFEVAAFGLSTLLAGKLGTIATSAHLVVMNIASITFMVPLGIGLAAATRIGNLIGDGRPQAARKSARWAFAMGGGTMLCFGLLFFFARDWLPTLYTKSEDEEVRRLAALILPIAGAFQVFDGIQIVGSGALRGAGLTRPSAVFNLIGYWGLALPLAWFLAFKADMGLPGIWSALALGLAIIAASLIVYWKRLDLKHLRRIETRRMG
ncbi:MAG: MATE family efflux transporter [Planctomycetota bacterium]|nr:MATE family efflux transporter [Planctomycetota bacterium]